MILVIPGAILIVLFVMGIVYWDASRRDLSQQARVRWTGSVGFVSSCGFVLSMYSFSDFFIHAYMNMFGPPPVVFTPYDLIMMLFKIGVVLSALAVLTYVVGSRFGPLKSQSRY